MILKLSTFFYDFSGHKMPRGRQIGKGKAFNKLTLAPSSSKFAAKAPL